MVSNGGRKATREALLLGTAFVLFSVVVLRSDAFEFFTDLLRKHEDWEFDELVLILVFLSLCSGTFAWLRFREAGKELVLRTVAEKRLEEINAGLEERVLERTARLEDANKALQDEITERITAEEQREALVEELQNALSNVRQLSGIVPICSCCKKIRDDSGYWQQVESYLRNHSAAEFSHSLCPDCLKSLYPELEEELGHR